MSFLKGQALYNKSKICKHIKLLRLSQSISVSETIFFVNLRCKSL